jgi:hypothetical protein
MEEGGGAVELAMRAKEEEEINQPWFDSGMGALARRGEPKHTKAWASGVQRGEN